MSDRPALPVGSAGAPDASMGSTAHPPEGAGALWLLEEARGGSAPLLAIADRLGMEYRRICLSWSLRGTLARFGRAGSVAGLRASLPLVEGAPAATLSAGRGAASVAAWLKQACGSRMIHYGPAGRHAAATDLHLLDGEPDTGMALIGPPHRLSALALQAARAAWSDRLDHLPRPRLALIVGSGPFGAELRPADAFRLAAGLARSLHAAGGSALAMVDRRTGREATDALAAGLGGCINLVYRPGEPGPSPELGFLAMADAVVVAGNTAAGLLRACALPVPVYVAPVGPLSPAQRRLERRLLAAGHIRVLEESIGTWPRKPLDEAARAAAAVLGLIA